LFPTLRISLNVLPIATIAVRARARRGEALLRRLAGHTKPGHDLGPQVPSRPEPGDGTAWKIIGCGALIDR
jgi:hypothetical protein